MNRAQQVLLVAGFLMVVAFNGILLGKLAETREENATLQGKMTLSLDEQFTLTEHAFEGEDLAPALRAFRLAEPRYAMLDPGNSELTLLLYFPNRSSCRRSLHSEVAILKDRRALLARNGVRVAIVFGSSIDEVDFQTMIRQFDIFDISVLDRQGVFQRHLGPRVGALAIAVGPMDRVLFAHLARTSSEDEDTRLLYDKLDVAAALRNDWMTEEKRVDVEAS